MCHSEQRDAMTSLFSGASSGHPLTSTDSGSRLTALGRAMVQFSLRCARCAGFRGVCRLALRWRRLCVSGRMVPRGPRTGEHGGGGV